MIVVSSCSFFFSKTDLFLADLSFGLLLQYLPPLVVFRALLSTVKQYECVPIIHLTP